MPQIISAAMTQIDTTIVLVNTTDADSARAWRRGSGLGIEKGRSIPKRPRPATPSVGELSRRVVIRLTHLLAMAVRTNAISSTSMIWSGLSTSQFTKFARSAFWPVLS